MASSEEIGELVGFLLRGAFGLVSKGVEAVAQDATKNVNKYNKYTEEFQDYSDHRLEKMRNDSNSLKRAAAKAEMQRRRSKSSSNDDS